MEVDQTKIESLYKIKTKLTVYWDSIWNNRIVKWIINWYVKKQN